MANSFFYSTPPTNFFFKEIKNKLKIDPCLTLKFHLYFILTQTQTLRRHKPGIQNLLYLHQIVKASHYNDRQPNEFELVKFF